MYDTYLSDGPVSKSPIWHVCPDSNHWNNTGDKTEHDQGMPLIVNFFIIMIISKQVLDIQQYFTNSLLLPLA